MGDPGTEGLLKITIVKPTTFYPGKEFHRSLSIYTLELSHSSLIPHIHSHTHTKHTHTYTKTYTQLPVRGWHPGPPLGEQKYKR